MQQMGKGYAVEVEVATRSGGVDASGHSERVSHGSNERPELNHTVPSMSTDKGEYQELVRQLRSTDSIGHLGMRSPFRPTRSPTAGKCLQYKILTK